MPSLQTQLLTNLSSAATPSQIYANQVLSLSPLAYWKANETSGTTLLDYSGNGSNRTYVGQDLASTDFYKLPDKAPLWGTGDYISLHGANFATAFNFAKGYLSFWYKVRAASVLSDATTRYLFIIQRDGANILSVFKTGTANQFNFRYTAGTTVKSVNITNSSSSWVNVIIEWADAANGSYFRAWANNSAIVTETTGIGTVSGSGLSATATVWGASNTSATSPWDGYLAHMLIKAGGVTDATTRSLLSAGQ